MKSSDRNEAFRAALERIADHPYAFDEPEAAVLAAIARMALGRPHGLHGLALKWFMKEVETAHD